MGVGGACFYCRHHTNGRIEESGWSYDCKLGIDNRDKNGYVEDVIACEKGAPQIGFQIGGYYTHMWFESNDNDTDPCLEWIICSDGQFPVDDDKDGIGFHVCGFYQLEHFVEFWGKELRRKGIIPPKGESAEQLLKEELRAEEKMENVEDQSEEP